MRLKIEARAKERLRRVKKMLRGQVKEEERAKEGGERKRDWEE